MLKENYLIEFVEKLDVLISLISRLEDKINLYKKNSIKFGFEFDVKFDMSPLYFIKLREYINKKIEDGCVYDRNIVNLKREFLRQYKYLIQNIKKEVSRINLVLEREMNKVVYKYIYEAKYEYEMKQVNLYNVCNTLIDKIVGIAKYRKLMKENHELKADLIEKEYNEQNFAYKKIFDLVIMIENTNFKNGRLLCLQDYIVKNFNIDTSLIKRSKDYEWTTVKFLPYGFFEKRMHYKILNKNVMMENEGLKEKLKSDRISEELSKNMNNKNSVLFNLNDKLSKILKLGLVLE